MPISRKKSCIPCRRAKRRCNLASTCSQCSDRGLQCSYAPFSRTVSSPIRPNVTMLLEESLDQGEANHSSVIDNNGDMYAFNSTTLESAEFGTDELGWPTPSWSDATIPCLIADGMNPGVLGETLEKPSSLPSNRLFSKDGQISASQDFVIEDIDGTAIIYGHVYHNLLSPRNSRNAQSLLTTSFIQGQLKAYPTLLVRSQLPPFIYPSCVLSDQLPQNCILNGMHQCLSPPLAMCASLVRIWEARTPSTMSLVWRSIYAEVKRLADEYREYSDDELLGAFQAVSIYLLMQVPDLQYRQPNNLVSLVVTVMEIANHLTQSRSALHLGNLFAYPNLTQRIWAFNESIRRTMALLFILESLLHEGITRHRDPMRCGGSDPIPLPGSRYLWDYQIRESWAFRLENARSGDGGLESQLTLGDLHKMGERDEAIIGRLARWCEDADEFGGLLRMSALLG